MHPDIIDAAKTPKPCKPSSPATSARVPEYLWQHYEKLAVHEMAALRKERNEALRELLEYVQKHQDLLIAFYRLQPDPDVPARAHAPTQQVDQSG